LVPLSKGRKGRFKKVIFKHKLIGGRGTIFITFSLTWIDHLHRRGKTMLLKVKSLVLTEKPGSLVLSPGIAEFLSTSEHPLVMSDTKG